MATSGNITFNETRDQLISNALSLLAVLAAGETASANDLTFGATILNQMIKALVGQGIHLWTEESGTIFLINGQSQYNLQAGASGVKASDGTGTPVESSLSIAASSGSTSITVNTTTDAGNMTSGDNIGVVQDNTTILWTTINGAPVGKVITLTSGLTNIASVGNQVFTYTTQMPRVVSIQSARLRNSQGFDRILEVRAREDYQRIPQKTLAGDPTIIYYSPQLSQGQVFLWPTPNNVNNRIEITYLREIQDFTNSSDNPDFPQEWLEAISYNLAVRLAPAYGISLSSGGIGGNPDLLVQATQYLDQLKAWDAEQSFIQIVPKNQYYPR